MTAERSGGSPAGDGGAGPGSSDATRAAVADAPFVDERTGADEPSGADPTPGTVEADLAALVDQPLGEASDQGEGGDRGGGPSDERSPGDAALLQDRAIAAVDAMTGGDRGAAIAEGGVVPRDPAPAGPGPGDGRADVATDASVDDGSGPEAPASSFGGVATAVDPGEVEQAPPASDAPADASRTGGREPTTMEELLSEQSGDIRSFKHGDVVEGTVVRIDKDEVLVDIGAKSEGVVSNRELYGRNAEAPQLSIGDSVLVYVLQPESNEGHVVLSLRRAGLERKWRAMQELFDAGTIIEAPVIDHNKGGLIVDCGIRGFVPISQIVDFPRRPQNEQPRDAAQEIAEKLQPFVGRKLRLKILEVNRKANRLILSEKVALYEERREKRDELFSSLRVGQQVTGSVRSIAPFGVFIDLGGIDGLVHKSELSWNKVNNPEHGYKVGDEVQAEVIDINHERGRISLSIRRLQPDPWHSTVADLNVGDVIDGTVTKIVNFGAFVRVRDGLEGLIHISELSNQRVAHPGDVVHEGQRLKLKVISLDSERHRLGLSLKQAEEPPARPQPAEPPPPRERERRPRPDRGYDPSQAVQEPEGGIDNTLAAAFAQVRQQVARSERDRGVADGAAAGSPVADEAIAGTGSGARDGSAMDIAARDGSTAGSPQVLSEATGLSDVAPSAVPAVTDDGSAAGLALEPTADTPAAAEDGDVRGDPASETAIGREAWGGESEPGSEDVTSGDGATSVAPAAEGSREAAIVDERGSAGVDDDAAEEPAAVATGDQGGAVTADEPTTATRGAEDAP